MKFWDTSALVPIMTLEERTVDMQRLIGADRNVIVSFITPIELTSTLWRRGRRFYAQDDFRRSLFRASQFESNWTVVDELDPISKLSRQMIMRHVLRTGDAIQLASALFFVGEHAAGLPFVTLDMDLRRAANLEGFPTLP